MKLNHSQFVFAREIKGLNQTQLVKSISGLSQSNLSKFEKGFDVLSDEKIQKLIDYLGFPKSFYQLKISNNAELAHYRKKSGLTKALKTELECNNRMLGYIVDKLSESVFFPDFTLKPLDPEYYAPEEVARYTRQLIGLNKDEPVVNIFHLLEDKGIVVIELKNVTEKFDGVSFVTDNGIPIIIINKNFPNDRKRFTLAHELGHVLMHNSGDFPVPEHRTLNEKENEANRFASEFLMPKDAIKNSLVDLRLYKLASLKKYWRTSKASLIRRAKDLKSIPESRAKYFMIELSRCGERRIEKTLVEIDKPVSYKKAYNLHRNDLEYSEDELAEAFYLSKEMINKYFNFNDKPKLRVVI